MQDGLCGVVISEREREVVLRVTDEDGDDLVAELRWKGGVGQVFDGELILSASVFPCVLPDQTYLELLPIHMPKAPHHQMIFSRQSTLAYEVIRNSTRMSPHQIKVQ